MIINKNVLKKDLKEINAIEKLFQFFISEQVDVENGNSAKLLYEELGWNQSASYDVINSFWLALAFSMVSSVSGTPFTSIEAPPIRRSV